MELCIVVFALLTAVSHELAMTLNLIQLLGLYSTKVAFVEYLTTWHQRVFVVFLKNLDFYWFESPRFILVKHVFKQDLRRNELKRSINNNSVFFLLLETRCCPNTIIHFLLVPVFRNLEKSCVSFEFKLDLDQMNFKLSFERVLAT